MKEKFPYAVVVSYSFDDDVGVYPCTSEKSAKALLKHFFENEVNIDKEENHPAESSIAEDGWSAQITNFRRDGSVDTTTWRIGTIYGEEAEFIG